MQDNMPTTGIVGVTTDPLAAGYDTKLDPSHEDFDKSLITDQSWWRSQASHDEDTSQSDPEIEVDYDNAIVVDATIKALESDDLYGPLMKASPGQRQATYGPLFYDGLFAKAYGLTYDEEIARAVVQLIRVNEKLGKPRRLGRSMSLKQFAAVAYPELRWIIKNLIPADGALGIEGAYAKAGKSTKWAAILKSIALGVPFCGLESYPTKALYVNMEEREPDVQRRLLTRFGIPEDNELIRPWFTRKRWSKGLKDDLCEEVAEHNFGLIVFDTLSKLWEIEDENSNSEVSAWLSGFQEFVHTKLKVTTILIHHAGKAGGRNGSSLRGASALAGDCDFIWEYGRVGGGKKKSDDDEESQPVKKTLRRLKTLGRYEEMVDEMLIDFDTDTFEFSLAGGSVSLPDGLVPKAPTKGDLVLDILCSESAHSFAEIEARTEAKQRTIESKMAALKKDGYSRVNDGVDADGNARFRMVRNSQ